VNTEAPSADAASSTASSSTSADTPPKSDGAGGTEETASANAASDGKAEGADSTQDEQADAKETKGDGTGPDEKADADAKAAADAADATSDADAAAAAKTASPPPTPEEELKALEEQLRAKKHEVLLAFADFENNKKRYMKERQIRRRNATVNFARKMVEVHDEFDELARAAPPEEPSDASKVLQEGVVLTGDFYKAALERFDVSQITPEPGNPFVTLQHEDVGSVPGSDLEAGSIAEVVQLGWLFPAADSTKPPTVLRRARVKLAAAAP